MVHVYRFDRDTIVSMLNALHSGAPIAAPGGAWNAYTLMTLAGVARFAILSQGPHHRQELPDYVEHLEAIWEKLTLEVDAMIRFSSTQVMLAEDQEFDSAFEPQGGIAIATTDDGVAVQFEPSDSVKPAFEDRPWL